MILEKKRKEMKQEMHLICQKYVEDGKKESVLCSFPLFFTHTILELELEVP